MGFCRSAPSRSSGCEARQKYISMVRAPSGHPSGLGRQGALYQNRGVPYQGLLGRGARAKVLAAVLRKCPVGGRAAEYLFTQNAYLAALDKT